MNEKFNKNAKVEQLTKKFLSREEEKGRIVKDPLWRGSDDWSDEWKEHYLSCLHIL